MGEVVAPRVLDTSSGIAGAYAALVLHQTGADVVRAVADDADPTLPAGGPLARYLRQGQGCIRRPGGGPGTTDALGADILLATPLPAGHEAARLAHDASPGLIVVAITAYGLDGPYAGRPASDLTIQADSGALAIRGNPGEEPVQMGGRTVEWLAGAYAAAAALALWRGRRAGGPGGLVDVSLAEVANIGAANFMDVFHAVDRGPHAEPIQPPRTFETPSIEPTSDGWVGFNTNAPHQAEAFMRMIGRADLAESGEFTFVGSRLARREEWQALVTAWTSTRTTDEVIAAALAHQVPVAPVCNGRTVAELDHVQARRALRPAAGGRFLVPARPWRIDGDAGADPLPAPEAATAPPGPPPWRSRRGSPPPAAGGQAVRPLRDLRVLDLTAWWAGPAATGLLAAFGADVIHVEGPGRMDGMRMVGASFLDRPDWWELSSFFLSINVNKRDLVLDIASERGRELTLALVAHVDVVVDNFTPRVLDRLGLGWDAVHAANPRAIQVRMPAFGLDGPWRDRPGFAQNIEQASGLAWITGQPHDQPRIQRGPSDPNGGVHAVVALLAALDQRDRTGTGCLVETSLFDAALPLASEAIIEWSAEGVLLGREGNRSRVAAPQGVYACSGDDAWLAVSATTDEQWGALAQVIGRDDLAADPTLATIAGRHADHDRLDGAIATWAAPQPLEQAVSRLASAGVPTAPARDPRLTAGHPQFAARGYHQVVAHPVAGRLPIPTQPFRVTGIDRWATSPAPRFGQHTEEVLRELLGLTDTDLATLRAEGTIADRPVGM